MTKICNTCGIEKEYEEFHIDRDRKDGHSSRCIECSKIKRHEDNLINDYSERVPALPGKYINERQKEYTFKLLEAMGWTYSGKIWYKKPLKDENGNWKFENVNILQKKKYNTSETNNSKYRKKVNEGKRFENKKKLITPPENYVPTNFDTTRSISLEAMTEIRRLYQETNMTQQMIAEQFGISQYYCNRIINYKR